jgi:hypothetical protein
MIFTISDCSKLDITVHGYIKKQEDPVLFLVSEDGRIVYANFLKELEIWEVSTVVRSADPTFVTIRRQWLQVADQGSMSAM